MNNMDDRHERITQPLPIRPDLTPAPAEEIPTAVAPTEDDRRSGASGVFRGAGGTSAWDEQEGQPTTVQETIEARRFGTFGKAAPDQDRITTPVPLTPSPEPAWTEPPRPRSSSALRAAVALCLILSLLSLALNAFLIYGLLNVRQTAAGGLDAAIAALDNFGGAGFHYDYHFEKTIPISERIPIKQDLLFPFNGDFPINTTVRVPIDAGVLGKYVIDVPINTSVHVSTTVPIHVDQTFQVSTTIPVSMTIPIDVKPGDPEIQRLLARVREWLVRLRSSFY